MLVYFGDSRQSILLYTELMFFAPVTWRETKIAMFSASAVWRERELNKIIKNFKMKCG